MSSELLAERILRFVGRKGYRPGKLNELARALGIGQEEMGDFHAACKALMRTGRIVLGVQDALTLPPPVGQVTGTFRANPRGFGFIVPQSPSDHGDVYVPAGATGGAITGDSVQAKIVRRGKRDGRMRYEGRVLEVLQRGQSRFVGALCRGLGRWFVVPDGNTLHVPIIVGDSTAKSARSGDQVVVEITDYPIEGGEARGVVTKVLGQRGAPGVDSQSIIEQYQLPAMFSDAVLSEARSVVDAYDPVREAEGRLVLSGLTIITIDPSDARDFDDAISLTRNADGTMELGVHIADVAYFVAEDGALDEAARERATSVYLPGTVLPMLPELLSNGVCSLQERQPRLTKSVFITYDDDGKVRGARFGNSVIRSTKRLTYEQASRILEGHAGRTSAKVIALLKDMSILARAIRGRRLQEGMFELDLPDAELVLNDEGEAVDVQPADTSFSHKIIEMFMVEANEAVARELFSRRIPFLRRIHDEPEELGDGTLQRFLGALGHRFPKNPDRFAIQSLLDKVRGQDDAFAVHLAILRSMKQAEYSPQRVGHYALASEHYCHFTSPIRRYPDLTVHRLFDWCLARAGAPNSASPPSTDSDELQRLGAHCSTKERHAEAAERELKLVLTLRLLEQHVGEEFAGVITGVASIGLFVQIERFLIDGLVRFGQMPDDWWEVDASHGAVIGQRSGRRFRVGDRLRVVVAQVNISTRQLDLSLVETPGSSHKRRGRAGGEEKARGGIKSRGRDRVPSRRSAKRGRQHRKA